MLAGPLFSREALTVPRQLSHFLIRSGYIGAFFVLMYTAAQTTFGWQQVRNLGDIARFGQLVFQVFAVVQLALMIFFSVLFAAGNVAQEKDRRTMLLLLMTDLRDRELVLGKLCSSLLLPCVLLTASIPVFVIIQMLGGISPQQITAAIAISAAAGLVAGTWGSLVAFWREKTFQTLAISLIGIVLYLGLVEGVVAILGAGSNLGLLIGTGNPFRAMFRVLDPLDHSGGLNFIEVALRSVGLLAALALVNIVVTILRVRVWNPSRTLGDMATLDEKDRGVVRPPRPVWNSPVIWREMMTKAYGRKVIVIKLAYVAIAAAAGYSVYSTPANSALVLGMVSPVGAAFIALSLLSMMLINAQGVTALTSERDTGTLELLLVTDISAKEFIYGKLGGVLYNSKELILIPLMFMIPGPDPVRGDAGIAFGPKLFDFPYGDCEQPGDDVLPVCWDLYLHDFDSAGAGFVRAAVAQLSGIHSGGKSRAMGVAHASKSIPCTDVGCGNLAVLYVLCDHQFPAGADFGCLSVRGRGLWIYHGRDADSGHQRI